MKRIYFLLWSCILLSACAAYRGASDVVQGREALLAGNNQAALIYFQQAEQADPDYIYGAELREGVASFLGRAQYLTGNYPQARQTLQKALSRAPNRQCRTVIPGPYVVSSRGPKSGTDEYPAWSDGN